MGVEWSGVEWSGVEWSGVEWSGVEWSASFDMNLNYLVDPTLGLPRMHLRQLQRLSRLRNL